MNLIAFGFRRPPVFRMGFDDHVRQWVRAMRRRLWLAYHTDPAFAAEFDAQEEAMRRLGI